MHAIAAVGPSSPLCRRRATALWRALSADGLFSAHSLPRVAMYEPGEICFIWDGCPRVHVTIDPGDLGAMEREGNFYVFVVYGLLPDRTLDVEHCDTDDVRTVVQLLWRSLGQPGAGAVQG